MSTDSFILLAFIVPALLAVLGLLFKLLYGLARLEQKVDEIAFELDNLHAGDAQNSEVSKIRI